MPDSSANKPFTIAQSSGIFSVFSMPHGKKDPGDWTEEKQQALDAKLRAENTPIKIAPNVDASLPPPPTNHYPDKTWQFVDGSWRGIPFPPYDGGGAYMYVGNVWQYVAHPKHHRYELWEGYGRDSTAYGHIYMDNGWKYVEHVKNAPDLHQWANIWRLTPPEELSEADRNTLLFINHDNGVFAQAVYDITHSEMMQKNLLRDVKGREFMQTLLIHDHPILAAGLMAGDVALNAVINGGFPLVAIVATFFLFRWHRRKTRREMAARRIRQQELAKVHGSARWSSVNEITDLLISTDNDRGLIIGNWWQDFNEGVKNAKPNWVPNFIRFRDNGHLLTFAPTGAGKGVSSIIPNLLLYPGSVICIDPKGENTNVTARCREEMGQKIIILDPFGRHDARLRDGTRRPVGTLNPLAFIDPNGVRASDDAALLAESILPRNPHSSNPFWDEEARALIAGLILYVADEAAPEDRNLGFVRDLMNDPPEKWQKTLEHMGTSSNKLVAAAGNRARQKEEKEASGVMSSAQAATHFLDSPLIRESLSGDGWDLSIFKKEAVTLYLVLPAEELAVHYKWLRLMISLLMTAMSRYMPKLPDGAVPPPDVLFLLDEFAALGHLSVIETAMGLMRGYGIKLWPILQDLPQLEKTYSKWQSFVANAGAIQFFGVNDQQTANYASTMLGQRTADTESSSYNHAQGGSTTYGTAARPLKMPDEIMRMKPHEQIVMLRGRHPILCGRVEYFDDARFAGKFDRQDGRPIKK